jgi:hypothetical protein
VILTVVFPASKSWTISWSAATLWPVALSLKKTSSPRSRVSGSTISSNAILTSVSSGTLMALGRGEKVRVGLWESEVSSVVKDTSAAMRWSPSFVRA